MEIKSLVFSLAIVALSCSSTKPTQISKPIEAEKDEGISWIWDETMVLDGSIQNYRWLSGSWPDKMEDLKDNYKNFPDYWTSLESVILENVGDTLNATFVMHKLQLQDSTVSLKGNLQLIYLDDKRMEGSLFSVYAYFQSGMTQKIKDSHFVTLRE